MTVPGPYSIGKCVPAPAAPHPNSHGLGFLPHSLASLMTSNAIGVPGSYTAPRIKLNDVRSTVNVIGRGFEGTLRDERFPYETWTGRDYRIDGEVTICPSSFLLLREGNEFHFQVWLATEGHGADSTDHGWLSELPEIGPRLAFTSHESRDAFEAWWRRYRSFYEADVPMDELPSLPEFERVSVTPVSHKNLKDAADLIERWAWITSNSVGGRAWFTDDHILFEFDQDAVAYRMRWTGA